MRTAADFDQLYQKPDPWDVLRPSVRDNVLRTIAGKYGAGKRILEFGCGEGQHTQMLASIGSSVLAVDISQAAVGRARARNLPKTQFVAADMVGFTPPQSVDVVFAIECLYYLSREEQNAFLAKMRGKTFIVSAPIIGGNEHRKYYTASELKELLLQHQLHVIDEYNLSLYWPRTALQRLLFLPLQVLRKLKMIDARTIRFVPRYFIYQRCYVCRG